MAADELAEARHGGRDLRRHHRHRRISQIAQDADGKDAESRSREGEADNDLTLESGTVSRSPSMDRRHIVAWEEHDPDNPYNWSTARKSMILVTTMTTVINSTMGSALPSNAIPFIMAEFGIRSTGSSAVLPISIYLVGYVFGPIMWAPVSESFGRRNLMLATYLLFCVFTMACALAPNWPALLIFRLFTGVFASSPIALVTGIMADIYEDPKTRGRAMALFMVATVFGPLFAPIISGYASPTIGWRWSFWIGLIYAGVALCPLIFIPETYGPVLLVRRANRIRRDDSKAQVIAPHELEKRDFKQLATVVLTRPIRMLLFELIVSTTCVYLALIYGIFYMCFQAFPIIFQNLYGLSPGECGLTFLSIGAGSVLSIPIFYAWDHVRARAAVCGGGAPWTRREEFRRLPLACLGGPLFVASMFWLGWAAGAGRVPFAVPMLAGIPFGAGFMLIFMALLNYLTDAYGVFAASANAAASCSRSLLGTVLPLATAPLFARLGVAGACSLLGGLSALMCAVPFVFIWKGERIRVGSRFCIALREGREEMTRKVEEQRRRGRADGRAGVVRGTGKEIV